MKKTPKAEQWLHANPKALASVKLGLKQAGEGKVAYLGSFSYPNLSNLLANVFGGFPTAQAAEKSYGDPNYITDMLGGYTVAQLTQAEADVTANLAFFKRIGKLSHGVKMAVPAEFESPKEWQEYAALMKTYAGLRTLEKIIKDND